MEALFEDAKICVLERFQRNEGQLKEALLEQSIKIIHRKGASDTDANTTQSVEDSASLQSTAMGEETVRTVEQQEEVLEKELPHDAVTAATNDTTTTEQTEQPVDEVVSQEEPDALEGSELPKCLLSSTVNGWSPNSRRSIESVDCESSATVELSVPLVTEEKVQAELNDVEDDDLDTISSDTSISIAQSLKETSEGSSISNITTPTTVTPTMAVESIENKDVVTNEPHQYDQTNEREDDDVKAISPKQNSSKLTLETTENSYDEDIFHTKSSSASATDQAATTSELAKRLATLHDELEELSETFERTPLMKSPITAASFAPKSDQFEDQNSSEETITFDYDDDRVESPSPSGDPSKDDDDKASNSASVSQNAAKIEVKLRSKVLTSSDTVAIVSSSNSVHNRDYPAPLQQLYHHHHHQTEPVSSSSSSPNIGVRMPDIINEAEVLRRQQLQIEQEIKELEQQVGFFREIPNKPPPPYIPPANGSPLALLFPSEPRIDELIDGRVEELHRDRIAPENLRSDHVTNVYEKLILDMCKELYRELRPAEPTVSFRTIPHDKRPLETHDDDARWTNFDREEIEVKDRITDELLKSLLAEALQDMVEACD
uniref:DUF4378 domain-containing protein n=1 Tax=Anopheles maculatus TaxID=74869 RepID=A0A182T7K5_9DIPT